MVYPGFLNLFLDLQKEADKDPAVDQVNAAIQKTNLSGSPVKAAGPSLLTPAEKDESNNNEDNLLTDSQPG